MDYSLTATFPGMLSPEIWFKSFYFTTFYEYIIYLYWKIVEIEQFLVIGISRTEKEINKKWRLRECVSFDFRTAFQK